MALKGVDLHNRLATSLFSLAFEREASGYTPNASTFSLPLNRYFNLQYFPPDGCTNRYIPIPSESLYCLSLAFADLT